MADVRRVALALPGVVEGQCYGTPAFYLGKKLMLRLREDAETLVAKTPIDGRDDLIDEAPHIFSLTPHYVNYPTVLVSLPNISQQRLATVIEDAWRYVATRRQVAAWEATRPQDLEA